MFGKAILPRVGAVGSLVSGSVGDAQLRLGFMAQGDMPFENPAGTRRFL